MKLRRKPTTTQLFGRFMMVASTVVMAGFLFLGGVLMGADGKGLFGEPVARGDQIVGQLLVLSGMALLPVAGLLLRREVQRFVVAALVIVIVDLVAFMLVQRSSAPMFGLVYAAVLGVGFKLSR
jgi:hypothetical protein